MQLGNKMKKRLIRAVQYLILFIVATIVMFPILWATISSFKPISEMVTIPPTIFPSRPTIDHYITLFSTYSIVRGLLNSIFVSTSSMLMTVVIASSAAYALTRFEYRFKDKLKELLYIAYMFPPILLAFPLMSIFVSLRLVDSLYGLMLAHLTFSVPFATLVLYPFFDDISRDIDEAAMIDGASRVRTLFSIIVPIALRGIVSVGVFAFIFSFNDYLWSLFLIRSSRNMPLSLTIANLFSVESDFFWHLVTTATVVTIIPILVVLYMLEDKIIRGLGTMHK